VPCTAIRFQALLPTMPLHTTAEAGRKASCRPASPATCIAWHGSGHRRCRAQLDRPAKGGQPGLARQAARGAIRGFVAYLATINQESETIPPGPPPHRASRTTPYLYPSAQIQPLMAAARDEGRAVRSCVQLPLYRALWRFVP